MNTTLYEMWTTATIGEILLGGAVIVLLCFLVYKIAYFIERKR